MFWRIGDGRFAFFCRARGLKPCSPQKAYAALNGRSSTVVYALVVAGVAVVGRRRWEENIERAENRAAEF
jgi:hypothetical protein